MRFVMGVVVGLAATVGALLLFIAKTEYGDWGRRLARILVRLAASGTPQEEQERWRQEWSAELEHVWTETERKCTGLVFAACLAGRYGVAGCLRLVQARLRLLRLQRSQRPVQAFEVSIPVETDRIRELGELLTADERAILRLRVVADLSVNETARILNKPKRTIKALKRRAERTFTLHLTQILSSSPAVDHLREQLIQMNAAAPGDSVAGGPT